MSVPKRKWNRDFSTIIYIIRSVSTTYNKIYQIRNRLASIGLYEDLLVTYTYYLTISNKADTLKFLLNRFFLKQKSQ